VTGVHAYPRPQLVRKSWTNLNGPWEFARDVDGVWDDPGDVRWERTITVPFAPETPASGVNDQSFYQAVWYRRTVDMDARAPGERVMLHFGAVDYTATVWIDDQFIGYHEGGYTPFAFDVTAQATEGAHVLVVRAGDDPHDLAKPRGKQDWMLEPHSIWYPRTTGIWQTVWMETVPQTRIARIRWTPNMERWEIGCAVRLEGEMRDYLALHVELRVGKELLADDVYTVIAGEVTRRIALSDPGIDDYRNEILWSPHSPTLIDALLTLLDRDGKPIDTVRSYTALRSISIQGDRIVLNGRPYALRMVLDQGYWPETGMTAPDDAALRRDVELAKQMGFNGVRKHQKVEDPRYFYWADRLGLLVWSEMPSAYRFTRAAIERLTNEWLRVVARDYSHPSIAAWVPFNESWGVPNLPDMPAERHFVEGLYHLTKTLDPNRPVIGNDGWESVATDIIGIHDYEDDPSRIAARYATGEKLLQRERPGGRLLTLESHGEQPIVLSEFGGIACTGGAGRITWGYSRAATPAELAQSYAALLKTVRAITLFAGFCYTQFADTYQEANGLLYADRTPKFPIEEIALATRGPRTAREEEADLEWRLRMMKFQRATD
jgi:beta-galactosidase/beta-glucuronidase